MNRALLLVWFIALAYLACWASPLSSFQFRFLVPLAPWLALLSAAGFTRLEAAFHSILGRRARGILRGMAVFFLLLNLPPFTSRHAGDGFGWEGWLTHVVHQVPIGVVAGIESGDAYLGRIVRSYPAWQYINAQLPPGARVLSFGGGENFYAGRARLWSDSTLARPATWGAGRDQQAQAREALRRLGVTYLLFDQRMIQAHPPETLAVAQPEMIDRWFTLEYEDPYFRLYRLREETH
jgi:hypothetical protein